MAIKVKAIQLGYYGNQRRRPGAIFTIKSEEMFSKVWMKKVKSVDEDEVEDEEDEDESHEELDSPDLNEFGKKRKGPKKKKQKPEPGPSDESVI